MSNCFPSLKRETKKNQTHQEVKGTVMQIEKALINGCLHVSKVSREFRIPTIYNFAVIYP